MSIIDQEKTSVPYTSSSHPSSVSLTITTNKTNALDQRETNKLPPTTMASTVPKTTNESNNCNNNSDSIEIEPSKSLPNSNLSTKTVAAESSDGNNTVEDRNVKGKESPDKGDDSLASSATAFTISFDDDDKAIKRFGIRDSIRKFAPPKPNTIEKPRPTKSEQCQDQLTSIESAPGCLSRHSPGRSSNISSSGRNRAATSSRQANVSDSVAFLIDKMLNCTKPTSTTTKSHTNIASKKSVDRKNLSSEDVSVSEIEYCETGSDNGTYVVGTDPETDAARKKIDELFGVVKAAEASVIADSKNNRNIKNNSRHSRSSSSSRQDTDVDQHHQQQRQPRASSRNSNKSFSQGQRNKPTRRSISQSSRQSAGRVGGETSDHSGTQSSNSSSNHDADERNLTSIKPTEHTSMKFNRAFDLRRARLGLGEPTTTTTSNSASSAGPRPVAAGQESVTDSVSSSQRRHQINSNTYRAHKGANLSASGGSGEASGNFSRQDGGRYSLRTKNMPLPSRLSSAHYHQNQVLNRVPHHGLTLLDQYSGKVMGNGGNKSAISSRNQQPSKTSNQLPYQSGDEFETSSSVSRYRMRFPYSRKEPSEVDTTSETNSLHYNHQLHPTGSQLHEESSRAQHRILVQPGALDSLVISAISSLSVKIHQSVCCVLIEQAKKLPADNETRLVVEEILPQLQAAPSTPIAPSSVEEIDQLLSMDLTKTLKNLKKVEQMVEVISQISNQLPFYAQDENDIIS